MDNGIIQSYSHHMRRIRILSFVFFHRRKGIHQRSAIFEHYRLAARWPKEFRENKKVKRAKESKLIMSDLNYDCTDQVFFHRMSNERNPKADFPLIVSYVPKLSLPLLINQ